MKTFLLRIFVLVVLFTCLTSKKSEVDKSIITIYDVASDILAEVTSDGTVAKGAITYGLGTDGGYTIPKQFEVDYKKPTLLDQLPPPSTLLPPPGPQESVQEVPSSTNYYDGSAHLNAIGIKCKVFSNPTDCAHQSECGWCNTSTGSCVSGNSLGPLEPCPKSDYLFSSPIPSWSPQTKIVTDADGGYTLAVAS